MIEKRDAAFDGAGHAHLVLLHEQLDEVGFLVRVQHAGEQGGLRLGVPVVQEGIVSARVRSAGSQQALLLGAGEGGIEIIEIERFEICAASHDGMLQLAADVSGKQAGAGDAASAPHRARRGARAR